MKIISIPIIILLLAISGINTVSELTYLTNKKNDYCNDKSLPTINLSEDDLQHLRSKRNNMFSNKYFDILNFFKNPKDKADDLFKSFMGPAVVLIIFIILVFFSFILFILLCCGFLTTDINLIKVCSGLASVILIIFVILFITILVFLGLSQDKVEDSMCATYKIPSGIIDGFNDSDNKFIGLSGLKNTLEKVNSEIDKFTEISANLENIIKKIPQSQTNLAWNRLFAFVGNNINNKITDADGLSKTPNSLLSMSPGINFLIESEFTILDTVANNLGTAAQEGSNFKGDATLRDNLSKMIVSVSAKIGDIITKIENVVKPGTDNLDIYVDYVLAGYWGLFSFGILIFILATIILIFLCCMCKNDKCWKCLKCGRVILVFLGFCLIIYVIVLFILLVGSATISGFCGFVGEVNKGNKKILDDFTALDIDLKKLIITCAYKDSDGKIENFLIENNDEFAKSYNSIYNFLDGISSYQYYRNNTSANNFSQNIRDINVVWTDLELGKTYDFDNIKTGLDSLNVLISCNNVSFDLYTNLCNSKAGCIGIRETDTFVPPSCSSDSAKATKLFQNLKKYINEEVGLINIFQNSVSDETNTNSVQSSFTVAKTTLNGLQDQVTTINDAFSNTFKISTTAYSRPWKNLQDCRALRKIMIQFEKKICFEFSHYVYILLVISAVTAILVVLMSWCLCFALRTTGDEKMPKAKKEPPTKFDQAKLISIQDGEKMPFY